MIGRRAGDQHVVAFATIDLGHVRLDRVALTGDAAVGQPVDFRGHRPRSVEVGHGRDPAFAVEGLVAAVVAVGVGRFEVDVTPSLLVPSPPTWRRLPLAPPMISSLPPSP